MAQPKSNMPPQDAASPDDSLPGRLRRYVRTQPAKSAATGLLACVLLVLLLRGVLSPKTVSADQPGRSPLSKTGAAQISPLTLQPEALLRAAMPTIAPPQAPASTPLAAPRDIFSVNLRRFTKVGNRSPDELEEATPAERSQTASARLSEIKQQAAALRLSGTVTGPASAAFLDGMAVAVGEQYRGFRVVQVNEQSVQLERDGVRLELRMPE